ncbi:hypothetical protein BTW15_18240 [Pseudomonas syringae pv. tomato]|uniref:CdiI immunity protein domain-containing protein n=1 Tax=Pseudomonas syringae pv. tomato TaxID=323 RepID=A0AB36KVK3_PSEUB|nr:hypothetical protein BTW15_18240 [Pseudomonas syringae pv. tomato]
MKHRNIRHMLKTVFCSDFNLPENVAINIYINSLNFSSKKHEMMRKLADCFDDQDISWRGLLANDEYEVLNFETEQEAKSYIRRVLWASLDEKI